MNFLAALKTVWRKTPVIRPCFWAGYRAVYKSLRWLHDFRLPNRDLTLDCLGKQLHVRNPRRSVIGRSIYLSGIWEHEVTRFISPRIRPGMTVLDVGGDIGYFTLLFSLGVGPTGRVLVFEPMPQVRKYLERNIEFNNLQNTQVCRFALADRAGTAILEAPFQLSAINLHKTVLAAEDVEVELKVYDRWSVETGVGPVDLVKIDIEGAELTALLGMADTIDSYRPAVLVEIHPERLAQFGQRPEQLVEFFVEKGYRGIPVDKSELVFDQGNITVYWEPDKAAGSDGPAAGSVARAQANPRQTHAKPN